MNVTREKNSLIPLYVIGFPKSGNTWLARLLAEMTQSNIAIKDSRNVVNAADNSPDRLGRYLIYKGHVVKDVEDVQRSKVVYIVRDIRDVLVSWFFHCNRWVSDEKAANNHLYNQYMNYEIRKSIDRLHGSIKSECIAAIRGLVKLVTNGESDRMIIGGWSDHVNLWAHHPNIVVVRYEDLLKDSECELRRITDLLGLAVHDGDIEEAVRNQSFKKKKVDFQQKGDVKNARFLRSGKPEGWRRFLSPSTVNEIEYKHADIMIKFGYLK